MAYRCFDAAPVQLFHDPRPCPPAKTFAREIPTAADCRRNDEHDCEPQNGNRQPPREGRLSILRVFDVSWFFDNSGHQRSGTEPQMTIDLHRFLQEIFSPRFYLCFICVNLWR